MSKTFPKHSDRGKNVPVTDQTELTDIILDIPQRGILAVLAGSRVS